MSLRLCGKTLSQETQKGLERWMARCSSREPKFDSLHHVPDMVAHNFRGSNTLLHFLSRIHTQVNKVAVVAALRPSGDSGIAMWPGAGYSS